MDLKEMMKDKREMVARYKEEMKRFRLELPNLRLLDLSIVSCISIYDSGSIYFYLDSEKSREDQQKFIHAVAKVYEVNFQKHQSFCGDSLNCVGETEAGRRIQINGYVPPTCHVEEVEEDAAEWEIEQAKKDLERAQILIAAGKKTVSRVVCK